MAASTERVANLPASSQTAGDKRPIHILICDDSGNVIASFGGAGVQYTKGDTDATPTGTVAMWTKADDTIHPASVADPLPAQSIGADTLAADQVAMTDTAAEIVAARTGRRSVTVVQLGTDSVYLGPTSGVTDTNGVILIGTIGAAATFEYAGALYGICASGESSTVAYVEEY